MAVCIAVIGKENSPKYLSCLDESNELQFYYKAHTSLDVIEEKLLAAGKSTPDIRELYMGLLYATEEHKIFGYVTNTRVKFIVIVDASHSTLRDNEIRGMFRKLHAAYMDVVCNPFHIPGDSIRSRAMAFTAGQKKGSAFMTNYLEACRSFGVVPPGYLNVKYPNQKMDFSVDRLKLSDWQPLLRTIGRDGSLHILRISSKHPHSLYLPDVTTKDKVQHMKRNSPVIFTAFMMGHLAGTLSSSLTLSKVLCVLDLHRLPFNPVTVKTMCNGLAKNTSLQHLSLRHCPIGDDGCEILCRTVMDRPNLITLALIDCQLTAKGAFHVSKLIKAQELVRFDESWKHTLRYQSVDHSLLPGLRRITLNGNPSIGDKGLAHIVDVVVDDLWMKAFDFQNCGISDEAFDMVHDLVRKNKEILVFDVRWNNMSVENLDTLFICLLENNRAAGNTDKYRWMREIVDDSTTCAVSVTSLSTKSAPCVSAHARESSLNHVHKSSLCTGDRSKIPKTGSRAATVSASKASSATSFKELESRKVTNRAGGTGISPSPKAKCAGWMGLTNISNLATIRERRQILQQSKLQENSQPVEKSPSKNNKKLVRQVLSHPDTRSIEFMTMAAKQLKQQVKEKLQYKTKPGQNELRQVKSYRQLQGCNEDDLSNAKAQTVPSEMRNDPKIKNSSPPFSPVRSSQDSTPKGPHNPANVPTARRQLELVEKGGASSQDSSSQQILSRLLMEKAGIILGQEFAENINCPTRSDSIPPRRSAGPFQWRAAFGGISVDNCWQTDSRTCTAGMSSALSEPPGYPVQTGALFSGVHMSWSRMSP